MSDDTPFVDYYRILQIDPDCDAKTLNAAFHHWAKVYHPDHPETADVDMFNAVVQAHRVLKNARQRAKYDKLHAANTGRVFSEAPASNGFAVDQDDALDDAEAHARILTVLYKRRREQSADAGMPAFMLQDMLGCTDDQFDFHRWYLKEKGFIAITEQGTMAITIEGVDHVIAMSRNNKVEKLLLAQSRREEG